MIDGHDERYMVEQDIFGATPPPRAPEWKDEALAYICDELCKHRIPGRTQEKLDAICEKCKVGRWAADPPTLTPREIRELRSLWRLLKEVEDYANGGTKAPPGQITHAKLVVDEPHDRKRLLEELNADLNGPPPTDHEPQGGGRSHDRPGDH